MGLSVIIIGLGFEFRKLTSYTCPLKLLLGIELVGFLEKIFYTKRPWLLDLFEYI